MIAIYQTILKDYFFKAQAQTLREGAEACQIRVDLSEDEFLIWNWLISKEGKIRQTRYRVSGNPTLIALCVWINEQVIGLNVKALKNIPVVYFIDSFHLPSTKRSAAYVVQQAIEKMILQHMSDQ